MLKKFLKSQKIRTLQKLEVSEPDEDPENEESLKSLRTLCPIPKFRRLARPRREDTCQSSRCLTGLAPAQISNIKWDLIILENFRRSRPLVWWVVRGCDCPDPPSRNPARQDIQNNCPIWKCTVEKKSKPCDTRYFSTVCLENISWKCARQDIEKNCATWEPDCSL